MLQEFWSYFMTTGQVEMYLNYKAYEEASSSHCSCQKLPGSENKVG